MGSILDYHPSPTTQFDVDRYETDELRGAYVTIRDGSLTLRLHLEGYHFTALRDACIEGEVLDRQSRDRIARAALTDATSDRWCPADHYHNPQNPVCMDTGCQMFGMVQHGEC